jgi:hypothetical protein
MFAQILENISSGICNSIIKTFDDNGSVPISMKWFSEKED